MHEFGWLYKLGCFWMQVTEKPTQKQKLVSCGDKSRGSGLRAQHVQTPVYCSEFPLVLSSFSLRLIVSSENMAGSRGRKEATHLWLLHKGPPLGFSCLVRQGWVTCPFPNPALERRMGRWRLVRPVGWVATEAEKSTTADVVKPRPVDAASLCFVLHF